ncbi:MAG: ribosome small subunit-dependent GTPase A [Chloroflexi bacterium]|nr:ribosome small subunit-dependent GTPase A [Chloroflexota bacterium]
MTEKLTNRHLKAMRKAFSRKEQRAQLKVQERERAAERAVRRARPPRQRDWADDDDTSTREKMRPGSRASRAASAPAAAAPRPAALTLGTVIEVRSSDSLVSFQGHTVSAKLRPGLRLDDSATRSALAVGDRVELEAAAEDQVRIVAVAQRRSWLSREIYDPNRDDASRRRHVIAANIDQVIVICSPAEPPFRPRLLDRYLVAASRDGLPAVICLNKSDLGVPDDVERALRGYAALGVDVLRTSALAGDGIDDARRLIAGKVSLFSGHSGVGKSSLLNALEEGLALRVGAVTGSTAGQGKGRHTTASARLVPLSTPDTYVVDTPGIRTFSVRGMDRHDLAGHFTEIAALAAGCSYRDCLHVREPGCAVAAGVGGDSFLRERLASYRGMLAELR